LLKEAIKDGGRKERGKGSAKILGIPADAAPVCTTEGTKWALILPEFLLNRGNASSNEGLKIPVR